MNIDWADHVSSRDFVYNYVDYTLDEGIPIYVGKGVAKRVTNTKLRNGKHGRVIACHGVKRVVVFSVTRGDNCLVLENERRLIALLRTFCRDSHLGCNFTRGGEGNLGWQPSDETRRKISDGVRANDFRWSDEERQRMSVQRRGKSHRAFTQAEKKNLSELALKRFQRDPFVDGVKEFVPKSARAIVRYNDDTSQTFSSVSVAARSVQCGDRRRVRNAIVTNTAYKGWMWRYENHQ